MPRPLSTPGKDPVPIVQEAGWAPGPGTGAENLAPPGFYPRTVEPVSSRYTDLATRPARQTFSLRNLVISRKYLNDSVSGSYCSLLV
jgi:hypothetical protein